MTNDVELVLTASLFAASGLTASKSRRSSGPFTALPRETLPNPSTWALVHKYRCFPSVTVVGTLVNRKEAWLRKPVLPFRSQSWGRIQPEVSLILAFIQI
jgi:hypothetical protein